jgi:hypothetical protein
MAEGNSTYMGLGVPLNGEVEITQKTLGNDIVTLTGVASQTGDFLVCQNSSGTEKLVLDKDGNLALSGRIDNMVLVSLELAGLASDASATVGCAGLATSHSVIIFPTAAIAGSSHFPIVWVNAATRLGYGAAGRACDAMTVAAWVFATV